MRGESEVEKEGRAAEEGCYHGGSIVQRPSADPRRLCLRFTPGRVDLGHFSPDAHWLRVSAQGHYLLRAAR